MAYVSNPGGGGMVRIAKTVLGTATATITFSSIPGTYTDLMLNIACRDTSGSGTDGQAALQINGDATAGNYFVNYMLGDSSGTGASAGDLPGITTGGQMIYCPGVSGLASAIGNSSLIIPNYAGTAFHKMVLVTGSERHSTSPIRRYVATRMMVWTNTAAITSLVITAPFATFDVGTTATLYGLG